MVLALATLTGVGTGQDAAAPKATTHMVAMADGVKLATDVYLPGDGKGSMAIERRPETRRPMLR